jgi:ketosteroid isomerase-like protein
VITRARIPRAISFVEYTNDGYTSMSDAELWQIKRVIRERSDLFEKHFGASDASGLVDDYYVQEPIMSAPDTAVLRGRQAIVVLFEAICKNFSGCRLVQHFVRGEGGFAYEVSSAHLVPRAGGEEVECRYLIVWRRELDTWRVETDFFAYGKLL